MTRSLRTSLLAALLGAVALDARPAGACEPPICQRGWVIPESGTIPQNAPGVVLFVSMTGRDGGAPDAAFFRAGHSINVSAKPRAFGERPWLAFDLLPVTGLSAGSELQLQAADPCPQTKHDLDASLTIGPAADKPIRLGKLVAGQARRSKLELATSSGSCSCFRDCVSISFEVEQDASALPWAGLLMWQTFVDGKLWRPRNAINIAPQPGGSWVGRGRDLVYSACDVSDGDPGVARGSHTIVMRATGPDAAELSTAPLSFELDCAKARPATQRVGQQLADAGAPATPSSAAPASRERCGCIAPGLRSGDDCAPACLMAALAYAARRARAARRRDGLVARDSR